MILSLLWMNYVALTLRHITWLVLMWSLFTNVPLEETIDIILHKIYISKKYDCHYNITENDMKTLLFLCTSNSCFVFNNEYYVQVDGVAMGLFFRSYFSEHIFGISRTAHHI